MRKEKITKTKSKPRRKQSSHKMQNLFQNLRRQNEFFVVAKVEVQEGNVHVEVNVPIEVLVQPLVNRMHIAEVIRDTLSQELFANLPIQ